MVLKTIQSLPEKGLQFIRYKLNKYMDTRYVICYLYKNGNYPSPRNLMARNILSY